MVAVETILQRGEDVHNSLPLDREAPVLDAPAALEERIRAGPVLVAILLRRRREATAAPIGIVTVTGGPCLSRLVRL